MADSRTKIEEVRQAVKNAIERKSAYGLPDRPSERGMKPAEIKKAFYAPMLDTANSLIGELNRVVGEINEIFESNNIFERLQKVDNFEENIKAYTDSQISSLVNGAPAQLDTLSELARALGDNENLAAEVTARLGALQEEITETKEHKTVPRMSVIDAITRQDEGKDWIYDFAAKYNRVYVEQSGNDWESATRRGVYNKYVLSANPGPIEDPDMKDWDYDEDGNPIKCNSYLDSIPMRMGYWGHIRVPDNLEAYDDPSLPEAVRNMSAISRFYLDHRLTALETETKSYVRTQVSSLVNGAPAQLDTLSELARALGDNENLAAEVTARLGALESSKVHSGNDTEGTARWIGALNTVTGKHSFTAGYNIKNNGPSSAGFGDGNIISGWAGLVSGRSNNDNGKQHVLIGGAGNSATRDMQALVGSYNELDADMMFGVGFGSSATRKSIFKVKKDGRAVLGADPAEPMDAATKRFVENQIAGLPLNKKTEIIDVLDLPTTQEDVNPNALYRKSAYEVTVIGYDDSTGETQAFEFNATLHIVDTLPEAGIPFDLDNAHFYIDNTGEIYEYTSYWCQAFAQIVPSVAEAVGAIFNIIVPKELLDGEMYAFDSASYINPNEAPRFIKLNEERSIIDVSELPHTNIKNAFYRTPSVLTTSVYIKNEDGSISENLFNGLPITCLVVEELPPSGLPFVDDFNNPTRAVLYFNVATAEVFVYYLGEWVNANNVGYTFEFINSIDQVTTPGIAYIITGTDAIKRINSKIYAYDGQWREIVINPESLKLYRHDFQIYFLNPEYIGSAYVTLYNHKSTATEWTDIPYLCGINAWITDNYGSDYLAEYTLAKFEIVSDVPTLIIGDRSFSNWVTISTNLQIKNETITEV